MHAIGVGGEVVVKEPRVPLQVLENIAARMKDMHEAGYVHRDLKPANVVLLPRENRWTVIDFGCAARTGSLAPLAFSLTYSPPEVIRMVEVQETCMEASAAVDVWALGVMAFELLTGSPAFRIVTDGIEKVCNVSVFGVRNAEILTVRI